MSGRQANTTVVLACGSLIVAVSLGIRHSLGLFLKPINQDLGLGREAFGLAFAIHNLVWGLAQPFTGMIADRLGAGRVVAIGALLFAAGLMLATRSASALDLYLTLGVLVGLGLSATTYPIILGVVGRTSSAENRSTMLGVVTAVGSLGMFSMVPFGQAMVDSVGWAPSLSVFALSAAVMAVLAAGLAGAPTANMAGEPDGQSLPQAIAEAISHRGYQLLLAGFFVCGFHVAFIGTHLSAFLTDKALDPMLGAAALALIGLFNIAGSYGAGVMGGRWRKKNLLCGLYLLRALAIAMFVLGPLDRPATLAFAAVMGLLWLSTVPLTSGLVGQIFGVRYMSTLFGIVFLAHQIGSFLGAWLGGRVYDLTGSYNPVWATAIGLSVTAAILNWLIADAPVTRLQAVPAERRKRP